MQQLLTPDGARSESTPVCKLAGSFSKDFMAVARRRGVIRPDLAACLSRGVQTRCGQYHGFLAAINCHKVTDGSDGSRPNFI